MHLPRAMQPREDVTKSSKQEVSIQWRIQDFPEGAPTSKLALFDIIGIIFCRKLHENERIWIRGTSLASPFRSVNAIRGRSMIPRSRGHQPTILPKFP